MEGERIVRVQVPFTVPGNLTLRMTVANLVLPYKNLCSFKLRRIMYSISLAKKKKDEWKEEVKHKENTLSAVILSDKLSGRT